MQGFSSDLDIHPVSGVTINRWASWPMESVPFRQVQQPAGRAVGPRSESWSVQYGGLCGYGDSVKISRQSQCGQGDRPQRMQKGKSRVRGRWERPQRMHLKYSLIPTCTYPMNARSPGAWMRMASHRPARVRGEHVQMEGKRRKDRG